MINDDEMIYEVILEGHVEVNSKQIKCSVTQTSHPSSWSWDNIFIIISDKTINFTWLMLKATHVQTFSIENEGDPVHIK